jgi:hypothetical protein
MISMAEHYLKIPSIPIFAIFQCENQIRLFDQIKTQQTLVKENSCQLMDNNCVAVYARVPLKAGLALAKKK